MKISLIIFIFSSSNLSQILKDQIKDYAVAYIHLHTHMYFLYLLYLSGNEHAQLGCCHWKVAVLSLLQGHAWSHLFPQACDEAHKQYFSACINHRNLCNLNVSCINGFSQINENEAYSLYWKVQAQYVLYDFYYNFKTFG